MPRSCRWGPASTRVRSRSPRRLCGSSCPFPPGGGTDVLARIFADRLRSQYPNGVVVDNRVGASGRLGVEAVKSAEPDGMTLLFVPDFLLTVYPHSFRKLGYGPLRDFVPVSIVARSGLALSAGPGLPESIRTVNDYVNWAKANPKQAFYATTFAGGTPHFVGVMLARSSGVTLTPVHYKGGAPAIQDLLGGRSRWRESGRGNPALRQGREDSSARDDGRTTFQVPAGSPHDGGVGLFRDRGGAVAGLPRPGSDTGGSRRPTCRLHRGRGEGTRSRRGHREDRKRGRDRFARRLPEDSGRRRRWRPIVQTSGFTAEE